MTDLILTNTAEEQARRDRSSCRAKNKYLTKAAARRARNLVQRTADVKISFYECTVCKAFHLTHADKTTQRERRRNARCS